MSDESLSHHSATLSRSAILHEVAQVFRRYRESSVAEGELAAAARMLCEDTRRRELPIERAIIDLKTALLSEAPDLTRGDSLLEARARFIQLTIEEYYRS